MTPEQEQTFQEHLVQLLPIASRHHINRQRDNWIRWVGEARGEEARIKDAEKQEREREKYTL